MPNLQIIQTKTKLTYLYCLSDWKKNKQKTNKTENM